MSSPPELPFPPVTRRHILNCSYHAWHPRYRTLTPKSRLIPLTKPFVDYLRADGIVLPPEPRGSSSQTVSSDDEDAEDDPSTAWLETQQAVTSTIASLGGRVTPKLNWSAPKDATWINPTNSMECRSANDVYMMLKSSDFVTHDLEHAFDGCADSSSSSLSEDERDIPYYLVLRKWVSAWNPSVEFRCFVRNRTLLGLCQRDMNHYDFLFDLRPKITNLITTVFEKEIKTTFPEENFVFDIYVPQPYNRVWLVDFNPWAVRTDPILFSWLELLTMEAPSDEQALEELDDVGEEAFVRLPIRTGAAIVHGNGAAGIPAMPPTPEESASSSSDDEDGFDESLESRVLELRLIKRSDPEAHTFNTPQYSAHKLPREVVNASSGGYDAEQMKDFSQKWQELVQHGKARQGDEDESDAD